MTESEWLEAQKVYDRIRALLVKDGQSMEQAQKTLETLIMFVIDSRLSNEESNVHLARFIEAMLKGDKPQC
jgi:Arc/MetJ-type ribon-helix-helix transcriptional regulator